MNKFKRLILESKPTLNSSADSGSAAILTPTTVSSGKIAFYPNPVGIWNSLLTRDIRGIVKPASKKDAVRNLKSLIGQARAEELYKDFEDYTSLLFNKREAGLAATI